MRVRIGIWSAVVLFASSALAEPASPSNRLEPTRTLSRSAFNRSERGRLEAGELVTRPMRFDKNDGHYVGGIGYQVVRARSEEVLAALQDVNNLPSVFPRTKRARLLDARSGEALVELTQGSALVDATYSVRLVRGQDTDVIRFWLDRDRPHGIRDVWGYLRVQPYGGHRSLITVAVALDVGPGLARMLFEDHIQAMVLTTPRYIRNFVEPRALASR